MKNGIKQIVIDTKAIVTLLTVVAIVWIGIQIKTIILALFISLIIALGLQPAVEYLVKNKIPHSLAVFLTYVGVLIIIVTLGTVAFTPMVNETIALLNNLPGYLESLSKIPELQILTKGLDEKIADQLSQVGGKAIETTLGAFSQAFMVLTVLVFTAYLLLDFENIRNLFIKLLPSTDRKDAKTTILEIENKLGHWLRGQILLMLIIGVVTTVGLLILNVNYALSLGLIAGLLEIVPIIGPIISLIPALIVGFGESPIQGIGVIGLYIVIQQLENNIIVPKVMQRAVGFNPLVTMLAILIGGKIFGVVGALIAIPTTLVLTILIRTFYKHLF